MEASPSIESTAPVIASERINTPSVILYNCDFPEVNRTLLSILILKWIWMGDYHTFTFAQTERVRLSYGTFEELRYFFELNLPGLEDFHDLIVLMIVSDLGKNPETARRWKQSQPEQSGDPANHDDAIYLSAKAGLEPAVLAQQRQEDIIGALEFGARLNLPQLVQGECPAGKLEGALCVRDKPRAYYLKILEVILDVAGSSANTEPRSSVTFTQSVCETFMFAQKRISEYIDGDVSIRACYDILLHHREAMLVRGGLTTFDAKTEEDRVLLRLFLMGRVYDAGLATRFIEAFKGLPVNIKIALIRGLSVTGIDDGVAVIPYYMPALFALALKNCLQSPEGEERVLMSILRFLSRVLGGTEIRHGQGGIFVERDVSFVLSLVLSREFGLNPDCLDHVNLPFAPLPVLPHAVAPSPF